MVGKDSGTLSESDWHLQSDPDFHEKIPIWGPLCYLTFNAYSAAKVRSGPSSVSQTTIKSREWSLHKEARIQLWPRGPTSADKLWCSTEDLLQTINFNSVINLVLLSEDSPGQRRTRTRRTRTRRLRVLNFVFMTHLRVCWSKIGKDTFVWTEKAKV